MNKRLVVPGMVCLWHKKHSLISVLIRILSVTCSKALPKSINCFVK